MAAAAAAQAASLNVGSSFNLWVQLGPARGGSYRRCSLHSAAPRVRVPLPLASGPGGSPAHAQFASAHLPHLRTHGPKRQPAALRVWVVFHFLLRATNRISRIRPGLVAHKSAPSAHVQDSTQVPVAAARTESRGRDN